MFSNGYLKVGSLGRVPIRLHFSLPIGALLASRLSFAPAVWLGFFLLVLLHEAGHAALARLFGFEVLGIQIHALGGDCRYSGTPTPRQRSIIAWGGVLAQAALLVVTQLLARLVSLPPSAVVAELFAVFVGVNVELMFITLMPVRPLDGAEAWRLPGLLWRARKARRARPRPLALVTPPQPRPSARPIALRPARFAVEDDEPPPLPAEVHAEVERILRDAVGKERKNKPNLTGLARP